MDEFDLGTYSRTITTGSADAQGWFDHGLAWVFGYNHEEAIACFEKALGADPDCAMAHWGIAYAAGPNYNLPWHLMDPKGKARALAQAFDATQSALKRCDGLDPEEIALIDALTARYPQREPIDNQSAWDQNFATRMREVHARFPRSLEVISVFAESIMNCTPWKMWDLRSGTPAEGAGTAEAMTVLETAFETLPEAWDHPGILHLYVHLLEMSPFPERALRAADRLRDIMPDGGHLVHMPTHIDVLCGHYRDVLNDNQRAIAADEKFAAARGRHNFYAAYRIHNFHFAIYGAMFLGQRGPALAAADALIANVPESLLRIESPPMADILEGYIPMKQHVMVRFGMWDEIVAQTLPDDPALYSATTAMMLYAKSVAHSARGSVDEAERTRDAFLEARQRVPETRRVHNNVLPDLLDVAEAMLLGELEYRRGNHAAGFDHLRRAVARDDALPYDEPWGWMQPARHALGALLLEQGELEEAEAVYRADLGLDASLGRSSQHPGNVWSLHGLSECLSRRGETVEIAHVRQSLDRALARCDVPIRASCLCRRNAA